MVYCVTVILICIFLVTNDPEHLFMGLLTSCVPFFGMGSVYIFCPFFMGLLFDFQLLNFESSLYSLDTSPLSDM